MATSQSSFSLGKNDRLKSRKALDALYNSGESVKSFPVKIIYHINVAEEESELKAAFSAPKRLHKKAVSRNLIKRRIKEVYRLQKPLITDSIGDKKLSVHLLYVFIGKEIVDYQTIYNAIEKANRLVIQSIEQYEEL